MNKYVRLENNVVVEVLKTSENISEMFHPSVKWIVCNVEEVQVGYSLVNQKWVKQEHTQDPLEEVLWRNSELARADVELNKVQDSDQSAIGSVADWRAYRKSLRAWPECKDFPCVSSRPKAPDFKG